MKNFNSCNIPILSKFDDSECDDLFGIKLSNPERKAKRQAQKDEKEELQLQKKRLKNERIAKGGPSGFEKALGTIGDTVKNIVSPTPPAEAGTYPPENTNESGSNAMLYVGVAVGLLVVTGIVIVLIKKLK